jgi:hypothetical protein
MAVNSIQYQLAESIQSVYKNAIVKKVDKDNFLDIHIPSINSSKGTHLFFNTVKGQIKLGFYVRDIEFIDKVLLKSSKNIESYSQGLRLIGNPQFNTVDQAITAAKDLLKAIDLTISIPKNVSKPDKLKKKVSTKPLTVKPKKEVKQLKSKKSISENVTTIPPSSNNPKTNWFETLLELIGKLFKK